MNNYKLNIQVQPKFRYLRTILLKTLFIFTTESMFQIVKHFRIWFCIKSTPLKKLIVLRRSLISFLNKCNMIWRETLRTGDLIYFSEWLKKTNEKHDYFFCACAFVLIKLYVSYKFSIPLMVRLWQYSLHRSLYVQYFILLFEAAFNYNFLYFKL
jgi:hypothetical protein